MADYVSMQYRLSEDFDPSTNYFLLSVPAVNFDYNPDPEVPRATADTYPYPAHSPGDEGTNVFAKVTWISSQEDGDVGSFSEELEIDTNLLDYELWVR